MKCMIMAGGLGTRISTYRPTVGVKALLKYKGKPLITHVIEKLPQDMSVLISANVKCRTYFQKWQQTINRKVKLCFEEAQTNDQKLGAVSAINFWVQRLNIDDDLLLIAGDNYFEFSLSEFIGAYNCRHVLVAVHKIGDLIKASQFGVVKLESSRIIQLEEKPQNPSDDLVSTGIYIMPTRTFPFLAQYCSGVKRDNLGEYISYLLTVDEAYAYCFTENWFDIGSEPDLVR